MFLLEKIKYLYSGIFFVNTAYNNPVHNARNCINSLNPLCRLCQDLMNNKCPKHLSFLITILTVSLLMICHSLYFSFLFLHAKIHGIFWINIDFSHFLFLIRFVRLKMFCIKTSFYIWSSYLLCNLKHICLTFLDRNI